MTREEAIKAFRGLYGVLLPREYYREAIQMAIEALSREPSEDAVSREAAIDAIVNTVSGIGLHDNSEVARYGATFRQHEIIDIIEGLSSAEQKPLKYSGTSICCYCKTTDCVGCLYEPMAERREE